MPNAGRLGDKAQCPADAHGCPGCAHPVIGPAVTGSSNVLINGMPALRVSDKGMHAACCGPNQWEAVKGSASVLINGKPAHRLGDMTQHCGGIGKLVEGSSNVIIGDAGGGGSAEQPKPPEEFDTLELVLRDPFGNEVSWSGVLSDVVVDGAVVESSDGFQSTSRREKKGAKGTALLFFDDPGTTDDEEGGV